MNKRCVLPIAMIFLAATGFAQPAPQAFPAELALPFGVSNGRLVINGDYLIFVPDPNVENAFVVAKENVQSASLDANGVLRVALRQPVRDSSGERTAFNFRFANAADGDAITQWSKSMPMSRSGAATSSAARAVDGQQFSYEVRHEHRIGGCNGRMIVTSDRIIFESLTEINDSRQWAMKDVKEVERKSPYKLDIKPFVGNNYSFSFLGTAMDNADFSTLTKLIAAARAAR